MMTVRNELPPSPQEDEAPPPRPHTPTVQLNLPRADNEPAALRRSSSVPQAPSWDSSAYDIPEPEAEAAGEEWESIPLAPPLLSLTYSTKSQRGARKSDATFFETDNLETFERPRAQMKVSQMLLERTYMILDSTQNASHSAPIIQATGRPTHEVVQDLKKSRIDVQFVASLTKIDVSNGSAEGLLEYLYQPNQYSAEFTRQLILTYHAWTTTEAMWDRFSLGVLQHGHANQAIQFILDTWLNYSLADFLQSPYISAKLQALLDDIILASPKDTIVTPFFRTIRVRLRELVDIRLLIVQMSRQIKVEMQKSRTGPHSSYS